MTRINVKQAQPEPGLFAGPIGKLFGAVMLALAVWAAVAGIAAGARWLQSAMHTVSHASQRAAQV